MRLMRRRADINVRAIILMLREEISDIFFFGNEKKRV